MSKATEQGIQTLIDLSQRSRAEGQLEEALALAEKAEQEAEALGDFPWTVKARWQHADALRMVGRYDEALERYGVLMELADGREGGERSLAAHPELAEHVASAFRDAADCLSRGAEDSRRDGFAVVAQGLSFLQRVGHPAWSHGLRLVQSRLHRAKGKLGEAREALEIGLAERLRDPDIRGYSVSGFLHELGDVLRHLGLLEEAEARYRQAVEKSENPLNRIHSLVGLGTVLMVRAAHQESEEVLSQALAMSAGMTNSADRIRLLRQRAQARRCLESLEGAEADAREAVALSAKGAVVDPGLATPAERNAALELAISYHVLAAILVDANKLDEAESMARQVRELYAALGNRERECDALVLLARIAGRRGHHQEQQALAAEAHDLVHDTGFARNHFRSLAELASASTALGQTAAAAQALAEMEGLVHVDAEAQIRLEQERAKLAKRAGSG